MLFVYSTVFQNNIINCVTYSNHSIHKLFFLKTVIQYCHCNPNYRSILNHSDFLRVKRSKREKIGQKWDSEGAELN